MSEKLPISEELAEELNQIMDESHTKGLVIAAIIAMKEIENPGRMISLILHLGMAAMGATSLKIAEKYGPETVVAFCEWHRDRGEAIVKDGESYL